MKNGKTWRTATAPALAALAIVGLALATAGAKDDEVPSIKEVMQKLHKGAKSPLAAIKKSLADDSPDWKDLQDKTKDFVILGAALAKNEPPKGEFESWKKLADGYFEDSKDLDDAAKEEDLKATRDAFKEVSGSCMACHKAHKG